jgi:hypothetical protein
MFAATMHKERIDTVCAESIAKAFITVNKQRCSKFLSQNVLSLNGLCYKLDIWIDYLLQRTIVLCSPFIQRHRPTKPLRRFGRQTFDRQTLGRQAFGRQDNSPTEHFTDRTFGLYLPKATHYSWHEVLRACVYLCPVSLAQLCIDFVIPGK